MDFSFGSRRNKGSAGTSFYWNYNSQQHQPFCCFVYPERLTLFLRSNDRQPSCPSEREAIWGFTMKNLPKLYMCFRLQFCFLYLHSAQTEVSYWDYCGNLTLRGGRLHFLPNEADTGQHELQLCKASSPLWSAPVKSLDLHACETWSSGDIFFWNGKAIRFACHKHR